MSVENWETKPHQKLSGRTKGIKKLPEDWQWEPVKIGSAYTSYGRGTVGMLLSETVYDCAFCRGSGQRPRGSNCPVCKSRGTVTLQPPVVMCAYCKGRGEDKPRSLITCTACKGNGLLSVKEPLESCGHCKGTGKEPISKLPCGSCRGSGVITVAEEVEATFGGAADREDGTLEKSSVRDADEYPGWATAPTGSEHDALEIILERGRAGRCTVGRLIGVSTSYAEMVCNSLSKKGLISKGEGRIYSPTPKGKKAMSRTN